MWNSRASYIFNSSLSILMQSSGRYCPQLHPFATLLFQPDICPAFILSHFPSAGQDNLSSGEMIHLAASCPRLLQSAWTPPSAAPEKIRAQSFPTESNYSNKFPRQTASKAGHLLQTTEWDSVCSRGFALCAARLIACAEEKTCLLLIPCLLSRSRMVVFHCQL